MKFFSKKQQKSKDNVKGNDIVKCKDNAEKVLLKEQSGFLLLKEQEGVTEPESSMSPEQILERADQR